MADFLVEYAQLKTSGLRYGNILFPVLIEAFICDAPAHSFIKCVKSHAGYDSCERCDIRGQRTASRIIFNNTTKCKMRNDVEFANQVYKRTGHQDKVNSPLIDIGYPCVSGFVLDYMHIVLLGVLK